MKNLKINLLIATLLVIVSCETVVDINVPIAPASLVVNSFLSTDSTTLTVDLSESDFILSESEFRQVTGADLRLTENGVENHVFEEVSDGRYQSDFQVVPGDTYMLTISKEGFETVSAEAVIPEESVEIQNVTTNEVIRDGSDRVLVKIEIDDPKDVHNFYEVGIYYYDVRYDWRTGEPIEGDSVAYFEYVEIDGTEFEDDATSYGQTVLLDDLFFNGLNYEIELLTWGLYNAGPSVPDEQRIQYYVTVRNVSEEYHNYVRSVRLQRSVDGDPFAEPVIVQGNISNGFGVFAGYSASTAEVHIE